MKDLRVHYGDDFNAIPEEHRNRLLRELGDCVAARLADPNTSAEVREAVEAAIEAEEAGQLTYADGKVYLYIGGWTLWWPLEYRPPKGHPGMN